MASNKRQKTNELPLWTKCLEEIALMLQGTVSAADARVLQALRRVDDIDTEEGRELVRDLESRHGAGFWQEGMERLTDEEFMVKVVAGGRAYALKMVGKPWRAHVYKQYRLQVAYIQEYFLARAEVVRKELGHLQRLAGEHDGSTVTVPDGDERLNLQSFFSRIWRTGRVRIVDLAGGPGCCGAGAYHFFEECKVNSIEATVLDPVEEWAWCSEKLGFKFRYASSLSDMILEDCTFTADVVLIGWAMNFASKLFWERLRVAFGQRAAALGPGCNHQALVMVVDRGMGALHFRDHRESVLQKPTVIQTDHGKNVTYSFLVGSMDSTSAADPSSESGDEAPAGSQE